MVRRRDFFTVSRAQDRVRGLAYIDQWASILSIADRVRA
jgi:hypothetical protein